MRPELPWTADTPPDPATQLEMRNICITCPVMQRCAAEAMFYLSNRGMIGGCYAGAWIPWPSYNESGETRRLRSSARRVLQRRSMTAITVYTKSACNDCYSTKRWLDKKNLSYTEINAEQDPSVRRQLEAEGFMRMPVIKTSDGKFWSGFRIDQLQALLTK